MNLYLSYWYQSVSDYIYFTGNQMTKGTTEEMKHVLGQLVGLNSPNSILKAAKVSISIPYQQTEFS